MTSRRQSRSRGASGWALRIYDALYENPDGLTRDQLLDECEERFNRSGTLEWFQQMMRGRESILVNKVRFTIRSDYVDVCALKMQTTMNGLRSHGHIESSAVCDHGERCTQHRIWKATDRPPRYWHPRSVRPGGFREYVPEEQTAIGARHALSMRWPSEVRAELARPKPRTAQLVRLLEDGLTLLDSQ